MLPAGGSNEEWIYSIDIGQTHWNHGLKINISSRFPLKSFGRVSTQKIMIYLLWEVFAKLVQYILELDHVTELKLINEANEFLTEQSETEIPLDEVQVNRDDCTLNFYFNTPPTLYIVPFLRFIKTAKTPRYPPRWSLSCVSVRHMKSS